jgi:hypothetical protein
VLVARYCGPGRRSSATVPVLVVADEPTDDAETIEPPLLRQHA